MRTPLVAGNWKMNGTLASVRGLVATLKEGTAGLQGVEIAVFPPHLHVPEVQALCAGTGIAWGVQNVSEHKSGAYTGEIAVSMLKDFDCRYALVGHSERRVLYGESDSIVAAKFAALRAAGIMPMLCIGETLEERESGDTERVVAEQLNAVVDREGVQSLTEAVIAYEPVWAIGTGKTASPEQAQAVHAYIRKLIADRDASVAEEARVLYGGSVKGANAAELFAMPDIDGGLVGGASLNGEEFLAIIRGAL